MQKSQTCESKLIHKRKQITTHFYQNETEIGDLQPGNFFMVYITITNVVQFNRQPKQERFCDK